MLRAMRHVFALVCGFALLSACSDEKDCNAALMIAVELRVSVPDTITITKVTAENESEVECEFSRGKAADEALYACYGQADGGYKIRIYSGDDVIYTETDEVEATECTVKKRAISEVDLYQLP